jgi:hypothetical protein
MAICAHPGVLTAQIAASLGVGFTVRQQLGRPRLLSAMRQPDVRSIRLQSP